MGHLDRRRQGLDSTSPTPVVVPLTPAPAAIPQSIPNDSSPYDKCIDVFTDVDDEVLAMDSIVYTRLFTTADFDATGRFPVPSAGSKYAYQLVSCFNGNIRLVPRPRTLLPTTILSSTGPAMVPCRPLSDSTLKHQLISNSSYKTKRKLLFSTFQPELIVPIGRKDAYAPGTLSPRLLPPPPSSLCHIGTN